MAMQKKEGFFQKAFGFLFFSNDPEVIKRKNLKKIGKEITRQRFKWYKPSSGEALPQMAKFFYEVYSTIGGAQNILSNANASAVLKTIVIEDFFSENQKKIKENLSEERLKERAQKENTNQLEIQVKKELDAFQRELNPEKIKQIDHLYSQLEAFSNFVLFDYYFMLKKFDSNIPERNFSYTPHYDTIRGEYVLDDLKDFAVVAFALPLSADWKQIFSIIKNYKGVEPAAINRWGKITRTLNEIRKSNILTLIIRHIDKNPGEQIKPTTVNSRIVDAYISKLRTQTETFLRQIIQNTRVSKSSELINQLFGSAPTSRMENYTDSRSEIFKRRNFAGFTHVDEINYLSCFLAAYLKKDITTITDLCLVRGKWAVQEESISFSNSFHALTDISEKLVEFDESLSEDSPLGSKLKSLMMRQEHDREARSQLNTNLKDVNNSALAMLTSATQNLIVIGKNLKAILGDYEAQPHKLIINWKEIESAADSNVKEMLITTYKKIYAFVMLMQLYLKGGA